MFLHSLHFRRLQQHRQQMLFWQSLQILKETSITLREKQSRSLKQQQRKGQPAPLQQTLHLRHSSFSTSLIARTQEASLSSWPQHRRSQTLNIKFRAYRTNKKSLLLHHSFWAPLMKLRELWVLQIVFVRSLMFSSTPCRRVMTTLNFRISNLLVRK